MIDIGKHDTKIAIQSLSLTAGPIGNRVESWTTVHSPWAKKRWLKGRELEEARQKVAKADVAFEVRYCSELEDLDAKHRVLEGTVEYDILDVQPIPGGRPEKFYILAETRIDES